MKSLKTQLNEAVKEGLVKISHHPTLPLDLYCYTKKCFYRREWTDVLIRARGLIYEREGSDFPINNPMPKIFHPDEHPSTEAEILAQRIKSEPYLLSDKVNGHLTMATLYKGEWLFYTKGSWTTPYLATDKTILQSNLLAHTGYFQEGATLGFEMVTEEDPHTMSEDSVNKYGQNSGVLLFVRGYNRENNVGYDYSFTGLHKIAQKLAVPVAKSYAVDGTEPYTLEELVDFKDREGFVIRFNRGDRFKIKTKDYLAKRYLFEQKNGNRIRNLFRKHWPNDLESFYENVPEEFHSKLEALEDDIEDIRDLCGHCARYEVSQIAKAEKKNITARDIQAGSHFKNSLAKTMALEVMNRGAVKDLTLKKWVLESYDFSEL